jgi:hypothetical protein
MSYARTTHPVCLEAAYLSMSVKAQQPEVPLRAFVTGASGHVASAFLLGG